MWAHIWVIVHQEMVGSSRFAQGAFFIFSLHRSTYSCCKFFADYFVCMCISVLQCPHCKQKCRIKDIRLLYATRLVAIDGHLQKVPFREKKIVVIFGVG